MLKPKALFLGLMAALVAGFALGGQAIPNWSAPATWTPTRSSGAHTMTDITNPLPFIGVTPCRVADTRGNGFTGAYGPPSLIADANRTFVIASQCGIPLTARAVSFNFGALNVGGAGDLRVFPDGGPLPLVSTMNYNANTPNIANAAVVPLGTTNGITVRADAVSVDLIIDVNGYYYDGTTGSLNVGQQLFIQGSLVSATIVGVNHSVSGGITSGTGGQVDGAGNTGSGVLGFQLSSTGVNYGVQGSNSSTTSGAAAVYGTSTGTTGVVYGVLGKISSASSNAAGVRGLVGAAPPSTSTFIAEGVRGESGVGIGVLGLSGGTLTGCCGVVGAVTNTAGSAIAEGFVAYNGSVPYGLYAQTGTIACNGCTKLFVEPHPADAMKSIHYVSLEGNEAGTYFRGSARTVHGQAIITVPDDFRIVTDEEGLTVQLTPVGGPASMYVESEDLNQIVVRSSRDVTFHYLVQGIRPDYKNFKAVVDGTDYMPQGPDEIMRAAWPEKVKRALISNGTYNADGTVNMSTAERVGWARIWADRQGATEAAARSREASLGFSR